jgi:hypothetical protein
LSFLLSGKEGPGANFCKGDDARVRNQREGSIKIMMRYLSNPNYSAKQHIVDGRAFNRKMRRSGAAKRALAVAEISSCPLMNLTPRQMHELFGVSYGYFYTAKKLTPQQLAEVSSNPKKLSAFHNRGRSAKVVDRVIKRFGIDFVFERLDAATPVAAE